MNELGIRFRILKTPWEKFLGAMFRRTLGSEVLVFSYEHPAERLFHTFFCPPLRILAVTDDGVSLADGVRQPGKFVRLPLTRLVVECSPQLELSPTDLSMIASLAEI